MKKMLLAVVAAGMLAGCSYEDGKVPKPYSEEVAAEKAQEVSKENLHVYSADMEKALTTMSGYIGDFGTLNTEASMNPNLIYTERWVKDMVEALMGMQMGIDIIKDIDPPKEMEESHDKVLEAMDEFQHVIDTYPTAIDTLDLDLLEEGITAMTEGGRLLDEASTMIDEAAEKYE